MFNVDGFRREALALLFAAVGCAVVLVLEACGESSSSRIAMPPSAGSTYSLMQMNLCLAGLGGCYGKVAYPAGVQQAVARIREAHPDAVTVNEACRGDVARIARRTGYRLRFARVIYQGKPLPCIQPGGRGLFGDAVLTKSAVESSDSRPFKAQAGIERRGWLCVTTRVGVEVCTAHLATLGLDEVAANGPQCEELRALLARRAASGTVIFGGDVNRPSSCAPDGFWSRSDRSAEQDPGLQQVYGTGALHSPSAKVLPATHTDHDFLLVRAHLAGHAPSIAKRNSPCGRVPSESVSYSHVVWLWMENQSYGAVADSRSAPFLVSLERRCGLATNYHSITHPSLPNYIGATSGVGRRALTRFATDCNPSASCSTSAPSIFAQVSSWRAYEESMPRPCDRSDAGLYAVRHNPPAYYRPLAGQCVRSDLPMDRLDAALARNSLPAFAFITPNVCHDSHSCAVSSADDWLAGEVEKIIQSRTYRAGHTALFITYDEGTGDIPANCAAHTHASSCHVATVVVSPSTPAGTRSAGRFNHYSLLRTTEDLLGLGHLGMAARARSMRSVFGL